MGGFLILINVVRLYFKIFMLVYIVINDVLKFRYGIDVFMEMDFFVFFVVC